MCESLKTYMLICCELDRECEFAKCDTQAQKHKVIPLERDQIRQAVAVDETCHTLSFTANDTCLTRSTRARSFNTFPGFVGCEAVSGGDRPQSSVLRLFTRIQKRLGIQPGCMTDIHTHTHTYITHTEAYLFTSHVELVHVHGAFSSAFVIAFTRVNVVRDGDVRVVVVVCCGCYSHVRERV